MSATAKVCRKCGVDVSGVERFKDAAGRYVCGPCAAVAKAPATKPAARPPEPETETFGLDVPVVSAPATSPCPECQRAMPADARICVGCGYNRDTGRVAQSITDPPGMTPKERKGKKAEGMVCINCGYDLKGLRAPKCPECGAVNSRFTQKKAGDKKELRGMYLRPLIGAGIGALIFAVVVGLSAGSPIIAGLSLAYLAVATVIGFVTFVVCSMLFIGFDEPLGVTFCRIACVWAVYNAVATTINLIPLGGLLLWPVKVLVFIGLLMSIMEIELEDAWGVAVACLLVNVGLTIAFMALLSQ